MMIPKTEVELIAKILKDHTTINTIWILHEETYNILKTRGYGVWHSSFLSSFNEGDKVPIYYAFSRTYIWGTIIHKWKTEHSSVGYKISINLEEKCHSIFIEKRIKDM